jgi:hypothetical protein
MVLEEGKIRVQDWIVVAFATIDTPYEFELSQHLLPSLEKLNIAYHIEVVENKRNWLKNVAQKPKVIYSAMEKYPSKNIVCLDADSEILEYPKLFNEIPENYNIALHILDWNYWYRNNSNVKEILSGTIFLRNNIETKEVVGEWYHRAMNSSIWEQKCLEAIIKEKNIPIYELPLEYCYINSLPGNKEPFIKIDNPVIKHFQASRKYRKLII